MLVTGILIGISILTVFWGIYNSKINNDWYKFSEKINKSWYDFFIEMNNKNNGGNHGT